MSNEQLITSIRQRLNNLSKQLSVPFEYIVTEFLIERLVYRLTANADLSQKLVFKGGYVSLRVYNSQRYTIDLDAVLHKGNKDTLINKIIESAQKDAGDNVFFKYESTIDIMDKSEYGGTRIVFRAGIGKIPKKVSMAQVIHFDVGIGDPITPEPVSLKTSRLLGDGDISWFVYPAESIVAEKLHTITIRLSDSSRSKDIYDLSLLLPLCKKELLQKAISATFKFREDAVPNSFASMLKSIDPILLKAGWKTATASLQSKPEFDSVYQEVVDNCSKLDL